MRTSTASMLSAKRALRIIRSMNLSMLHDMPSRAVLVGRILARTGVVVENLDAEAMHAVILRSRPPKTQISLFNMLQDRLEDTEVRDLLALPPDSMPDIRPGWATPRIEESDVNRAFASWLQDRKFIPSWKQGGFFNDDTRMVMAGLLLMDPRCSACLPQRSIPTLRSSLHLTRAPSTHPAQRVRASTKSSPFRGEHVERRDQLCRTRPRAKG